MKNNKEEKIIPFAKNSNSFNFKDFGEAIMIKDIKKATRILRDILGLDYKTSENSVIKFLESFEKDPSFLMETMQIRSHIMKDETNEALELIQRMFHIDGIDGLKALESMKKIVGK